MEKLIKIITFPKILTLIWVAIVVVFFIELEFLGAFALSIMIGLICLTILSSYNDRLLEKKSFQSPNIISNNDVGQMFRVTNIDGEKIGLVKWGYKKYSVGDLQSYKNYYFISGIPIALRNKNTFLQINFIDGKGLVFYKIQVNIPINRKKKPFEILNQIYTV